MSAVQAQDRDRRDPLVGNTAQVVCQADARARQLPRAGAAQGVSGAALLSRVRADFDLGGLLGGVFGAESLDEALRLRDTLAAGE